MTDISVFLVARFAEDEEWMHEAQRQGDFGADIPNRILAECEKNRRIVELHHNQKRDNPVAGRSCDVCCSYVDNFEDRPDLEFDPYPCATLRLVALPYAGHPDFRQEWVL